MMYSLAHGVMPRFGGLNVIVDASRWHKPNVTIELDPTTEVGLAQYRLLKHDGEDELELARNHPELKTLEVEIKDYAEGLRDRGVSVEDIPEEIRSNWEDYCGFKLMEIVESLEPQIRGSAKFLRGIAQRTGLFPASLEPSSLVGTFFAQKPWFRKTMEEGDFEVERVERSPTIPAIRFVLTQHEVEHDDGSMSDQPARH